MRGGHNGNRYISSVIVASSGDSYRIMGYPSVIGGMKVVLAAPPVQGTGFAGVTDHDGSAHSAFCPCNCGESIKAFWTPLLSLNVREGKCESDNSP